MRPAFAAEPVIIDRQQQLGELCDRCRAEGRFGFDTEFVMEDRYGSEVCLIQVATGTTVAIIDPFLGLKLEELWELVGDDQVETVVHAGQEDLSLSVQHTGRIPRRVFDLQIAAGLVGLDFPISLQRLVQGTLHVRVHKSKTLTNWRRRPLTAAQIRYAAEDVVYLPALHEQLKTRLGQLGRTAWAAEEFAWYENMLLYRPTEEDKLQRLKGMGAFKGRQLAVARELLAWRDEAAKRVNRPPRVLLKDHLVVEIAKHGLTDSAEIRELRGLNLSNQNLRTVCRVVTDALATPSNSWPTPKPRDEETPREATLAALATAVTRSYCFDHQLAYGLVATQRSIRQLVRHCTIHEPADRATVELLNGWRGESIGMMLYEVLSGKRVIRVQPGDPEPTLDVALISESTA